MMGSLQVTFIFSHFDNRYDNKNKTKTKTNSFKLKLS